MSDDQMIKVIQWVLEQARLQGWNQRELAARMGVSSQDITNWKTRGLPADKLDAAARALHCKIDEVRNCRRNAPQPVWPFRLELFDDFIELDLEQREEIEEIVEDRVKRFKQKNGPRRRKKSVED